MTNLEYLNNMKKADGDIDEVIKKARNELFADDKAIGKVIIEYRKIKALEIIAEELIKQNENSGGIVMALENIETALNRR